MIGGMGAALAVNWREIRAIVETGVPIPDVAARFGLPDKVEAIYKRAQREGWLSQKKVASVYKTQEALRLSSAVHQTPKAVQIAREAAQDYRLQHTERTRKILNSVWEKVENAPPVVSDVSDLEKLDKMTRLNEGMTIGEAAASIQVLFAGAESVPTFDMEAVEAVEVSGDGGLIEV